MLLEKGKVSMTLIPTLISFILTLPVPFLCMIFPNDGSDLTVG